MKINALPDVKYLRYLFNYQEGKLFWAISRGNVLKGDRTGSVRGKGYRSLGIDGIRYFEHRVIWSWHYGAIPEGYQIDHFNGNKQDNRIENLRLATHSDNSSNCGITRTNTSGHKGVSWCREKRRWVAAISINGKTINLGRYNDKGDAAKAYIEASVIHRGEFARFS